MASRHLAGLNEIDHLVLVAAGVNIRVAPDRHGARVQRLVPQRIAHLLFEAFRFGSLLNHRFTPKPDARRPKTRNHFGRSQAYLKNRKQPRE